MEIKKQFNNLTCLAAWRAIKQSNSGFTLIELLVSLVIIGSFGTIAVNILSSTFRGSSKTDVVNKVRENGNYAISEISRKIKYAKIFDGVSLNGATNWTCDIVPAPPVQYKAVKITLFDGAQTIFDCQGDSITSNGVLLMDTSPTGSVMLSPGTCFFTCQKESSFDTPTVGINFTLNARAPAGLVEKQATIPFKTSVKVRN